MRIVIAAAMLVMVAGGARADVIQAGGPEPFAGPVVGPVEPIGGATRSLVARSAVVDHHSGTAVPVVTRLHPVVGSVQQRHTSHVTGKSNYKSTVYNPVSGTFGTYKFRR